MPKNFQKYLQNGVKAIVFALSMLACFQAYAQVDIHWGEFDDDFPEEENKPREYKVLPVVLPAYPEEENLLPFDISPTQTQSFFVDSKSLTVSPDEIRYTLVTKSSSGAVNVSYEGIRCGSKEFRRYAYGHNKDRKWVNSKNEIWRKINYYAANRPRAVLSLEYFCDEKAIEGHADDMLNRLRYHRAIDDQRYTGNAF